MQTECSPDLFGFAAVESREVVAGFDGGSISVVFPQIVERGSE
jgi:hypothetical protein